MKCRICGVEYNDTDRFCGICGTPNPIFEVKPVVSPETTPTSDNPDKINELYDTAETVSAAETADNDKSDDNDKSVEANQAKEDAVSREQTVAPSETENSVDFPDPTAANIDSHTPAFFGGSDSSDVSVSVCGNDRPNAAETAVADSDVVSETQTYSADRNIHGETPAEGTAGAVSSEATGNKEVTEAWKTNVGFENERISPKFDKPQKEKRVCSLSAVVVCIIVILFLSVALGAVSGLYIGEKRRGMNMRNGSFLPAQSHSYYSY